MATVKGKWLFNDEVTQIAPDPGKGNTTVVQEVNFTFIKWDGSIEQANGIGVHRDSYKFSLVYLDGTTILSWAYIYRVYSGSWSTGWDNENGKTITFIEEQEVSDEFYEWFTANATQVIESTPTTITYNGTETTIEAGQTATLACNGKKALTDVVVVFGVDGSITYNGTETAVSAGQTATMACAGKKMLTDVFVSIDIVKTHAFYNGVRLPLIPEDILAAYPYAWIRKNTSSGHYDLLLCKTKRYYQSGIEPGDECKWYRIEIASADSAVVWTFYTTTTGDFGVDSTRSVLWSNHDIPNGSATATDIYFYGSEPVPTE